MLTYERLKELVEYDPLTGIFTRKTRTSTRVNVGDVAGWVDKSTGYVRVSLDGKTYRVNRLAWLYMTGEWPARDVDHKNRKRDDNRWENLRPCSRSQNCRNRNSQRNSTSGEPGVCFDKESGKWLAYIYVERRQIKLGRFLEKSCAVAARRSAEAQYHGEFSPRAAQKDIAWYLALGPFVQGGSVSAPAA